MKANVQPDKREDEDELENKVESIDPVNNSTNSEFSADRVKTPDLSQRLYELPQVTKNTLVNTLLSSVIEGGDAEMNVPDLKQLDQATAQDTADNMLRTIHHVDVQTNLVYKHWLGKTCKAIKEADVLQSKEIKKLKDIKELSKVCRASIQALRKQKVTETHPKPKPLGEGKAGFEVVNPDERSREYSYKDHTSSMLDSGNEFTKGTILSNRRGESVVINLGQARMVRGIVTQGHKLTTSYMYTYNVQYQDELNKWHTISDNKIQDTPNWNSGHYSKRCVDKSNWRSRRYGWHNGQYQALPCGWFESKKYCIRRKPPSRGYTKYGWMRKSSWSWPQSNCCACGKQFEKRTCADYVSNGWCSNGHVTFQRNSNLLDYFDSKHRFPMSHCKACGKGAIAFTGGQYDNKVTAFLEKPVKAKAIRIITKTGYPVFRAGVIVGISEVAVTLAGTPWVGSVNFDFPHHPYKILTSNDGSSWKLAVSGVNKPTFYFNPPLHTSHIKLDYEQESCLLYGAKPLSEEQITALGFKLVRRNGAKQGTHMHPAKDELAGTESYGTACTGAGAGTCNRDFSTRWSDQAYDEFLITTGNLKHWVQVKKSQVLGWYSNSARTVMCSSESKTEHTIRWYRRTGVFQDPWISIKDYHSDEKEAQVAPSGRLSECARGGVHTNVYDDNDGKATGSGTRRYLSRGDSSNSHTESTINSDRGWSSCEKTRGHWLQFDLGATKKVKGVITQPRADRREWVTAFKVRYTASSETTKGWKWAKPQKGSTFQAPGWDGENGSVQTKNYFANTIEARYVRLYPVRWNAGGYPGLRADVLLDSGVNPVFLYGEHSYAGLGKTRASREHQGLNVYIRMAYKRAKLPTTIPVRFEGYTADPGDMIFPDSKPRLDACGDATKKKQAKEIALEEYQKIKQDLAKHRKNIAENVDYINNVEGIRARTETFRLDYSTALNDTIDWSHVLLKANISLTTVASAENKNEKPDPDDGDSQEAGEEDEVMPQNIMSKEDREELEKEKEQQDVNPNSDDLDDEEESPARPPEPVSPDSTSTNSIEMGQGKVMSQCMIRTYTLTQRHEDGDANIHIGAHKQIYINTDTRA